MKKSLTIIFNFLIISQLATAQNLPSVAEILNNYATAIGGKEAINKVQDMTISSNAEMGPMTMETEMKYKFPNKFRQATYMMGNEGRLMISDGSKVFTHQAGFGGRPEVNETKEGKDAAALMLDNNPFAEFSYDTEKIVGVFQGIEKIGDVEAYKIEFTTPEGKKWTDFFDKNTALKIQKTSLTKTPRGETTVLISYGNYKESNGIKMPFTITRKFGDREMKSEVQSVKINKGLKEKDFEIK